MSKRTAALLPVTEALLRDLGERLRIARLRRRLQARQVAERAGMNVMTLRALERGAPGVTMGAYAAVLQVLSIEQDLARVAAEDPLGRALQDKAPFLKARRQPRKSARLSEPAAVPASPGLQPSEVAEPEGAGGAISTEDLERLLKP
jgi:transcriptional regulator with XRE-family HTH domain